MQKRPVPRAAQKGFTLIELMIVVAIIGILASVAMPLYSDYSSRSRGMNVLKEVDGVKAKVAMCYVDLGTLAGCDAGSNGIPAVTDLDKVKSKNITSWTSIKDGVITVATGATAADTAGTPLGGVYTPTISTGGTALVWTMSGTLCNDKRGLKPGEGGCVATP